jgi:hypothetical protein
MVKRSVAAKLNGFEEQFTGMFEDQVFLAKIALEYSILVTNECGEKYRQNPDSCYSMAINRNETQEAHISYLNWLESFLIQKNYKNSGIWRDMKREKWLRKHLAIYKYYKKYRKLERYLRHKLI